MIKNVKERNDKVSIESIRKEKINNLITMFTDKNGNFDLENFKKYVTDNGNNFVKEGYGLNFLGKKAAELMSGLDSTAVFVEDKEHNEKEENKNSQNIYISADNLEALRHLRHSYYGKIKCIYIDPPYNTGKNDFCYNDSFSYNKEELREKLGIDEDEADRILSMQNRHGNSHSAWLSFMYARLLIARDLLSDDGVIFISIDDNEHANLKLLCDQVFIEENYLGSIIQNKGNAQNDAKNIQKNHEYIVTYIKQRQYINEKEKSVFYNESVGPERVYVDENGKHYCIGSGITTGGEGGTLNNRPNLGYSIYYNKESKDKIAICDYDINKAKTCNDIKELYVDDEQLLKEGYIPIRPQKKGNALGCWTWELKRFNKDKENILITEDFKVYKKIFVKESDVYDGENDNYKYADIIKERNNIKSIQNFSSSMGSKILKKIFSHKYFDNPKNVDMIKFLIKSLEEKDITIVDFFSGSATTAHAVMELNSEDGGNRHIISVQLPENLDENYKKDKKQITKDQIQLCDECGYPHTLDYIGIERIKRAAKKIKDETDADIDYGFKHYTLLKKEDEASVLNLLEKYNPNIAEITQDKILNEFSIESRLITFLCDDGFGLTPKYEIVDLNEYRAYYIKKSLYFLDKGFDIEQNKALVKFIEKNEVNRLVIYGYAFSTREMQQLKDNLEKFDLDDENIDIKY